MSRWQTTERLGREMQESTSLATVQVLEKGGQGVLVPGAFVLTAAHCINYYLSGGMALGDDCLERIKTKSGAIFALSVYAVEPVADIAVLGAPDAHVFDADAEAFEMFCDATQPVPIGTADFDVRKMVRVHVLTHTGTWITGHAMRYGAPGATISIMTERMVESGTSGGPVVDDSGHLVGLVSWSSQTETSTGRIARPHLALPCWIWRQIQDEQAEDGAAT